MKLNRLISPSIVVLAAVFLSACGAPPVNNWPGLVADSEKAYVAGGQFIYAVNLEDGSEAWHYPSEPDNRRQFFSTLTLAPDGQLLAGSAGSDHAFLSINPATGEENWTGPFAGGGDTWLAPPLVWNGLIYAPNSDGKLYVLEADGRLVESVELGGALWSQPVTDGAMLYVASLDHHLHVIDPSSLDIVRTVDLGAAIPGNPTPALNGVYVGSFSRKMEFVSADGKRETLSEAEDWIWGAPALHGETLYFADLGGQLYSLDLASRRNKWGKLQPDGPVAASPVVIAEQVIIVTESGSVHAFDHDGRETWPRPYETGGKIYTPPVAAGELILVAPYQAQFMLAALDSEGRQAWLFTPEQ